LERLKLGFKVSMPLNEEGIEEKLTFDAAFYFMIVTVTTVGYGDIKPETDLARGIIAIFIILMIIIVSKQTSDLNELMKANCLNIKKPLFLF
jgi:voltage-gated potassium channel Kch